MLLSRSLVLVATIWPVTRAATVDINDAASLKAAAQQSISNLLSLYVPNSQGVFEQASTPWFASCIIYDMVFDYSRFTGDTQFNGLVTAALANISFGDTADILDGSSNALQSLSGKWNDDIGWCAMAIQSGAEIYGANNEMPGISASWQTVPEKTLWEMEEQLDDACNGGIYWSRNRLDESRKNWKSAITNWEFNDVATRVYYQTKNQSLLQTVTAIEGWLTSSGLLLADGTCGDGLMVPTCAVSKAAWSYTYGEALSTVAWLYKVTGQQSYLDQGSAILNKALGLFAPANIVTELCEPSVQCNRDQQHFKGVLLRKMAYFHRMTNSEDDKQKIQAAISGSIDNMAPYCNNQWVCPGNWTTQRVAHLYPADLHSSSSLLVAALGVFQTMTGSDLIPDSQLAATSSSTPSNKSKDSSNAISNLSSSPIFTTLSLLTLVSLTFWAL